jgi:hypothetical protein
VILTKPQHSQQPHTIEISLSANKGFIRAIVIDGTYLCSLDRTGEEAREVERPCARNGNGALEGHSRHVREVRSVVECEMREDNSAVCAGVAVTLEVVRHGLIARANTLGNHDGDGLVPSQTGFLRET